MWLIYREQQNIWKAISHSIEPDVWLPLVTYIVWANNEACGETALMLRLTRAFPVRIF